MTHELRATRWRLQAAFELWCGIDVASATGGSKSLLSDAIGQPALHVYSWTREVRAGIGHATEDQSMTNLRILAKGGWLIGLVALLISGCASTSLTSEWRDPDYSGPAIDRVLVVGVSAQPGPRRIFEDEFAAALKSAGIHAVPSHTRIPEDGQAAEDVLREAIAETGANGVLVARLVKTEQKIRVSPGYYRPVGLYGWYSSAWVGYYEPPTVSEYEIVTAETSLYGLDARRLIWSGTTETFSPQDIRKETREYAQVIIDALARQGILP